VERQERGRHRVKGVSQLFGSRVAVYTLDMESSRGRGVKPAGEIKIALRESR